MNYGNKSQFHLHVPREPIVQDIDESPIDRYGPSLRGNSGQDFRLARKSSCYSRSSDANSFQGSEDTKLPELNIEEDIEVISRPTPAHISVYSALYSTQHGNESRLILQGLSDPYRSGISSISGYRESCGGRINPAPESLQLLYPLRIRKTPSPLPYTPGQNRQLEDTPNMSPDPSPRLANLPISAVISERLSVASPAFRAPTSLGSSTRVPSGIVIGSTSWLGQYSVELEKLNIRSRIYQYPPRKDVILIMVAVVLATFCTTLDKVIISTAIPRITSQFNAVEDIGLYTGSYFLAACSSHLLYAKLYRLYTTKWIYMTALLIFDLGLLVSGVAQTSAMLIVGRGLTGLGASGVWAGSALMMGHCMQLSQIWGLFVVFYGALFVNGPVLGGFLAQYASWRWCFFVGMPFALSSCILLLFSNWSSAPDENGHLSWRQKLPLLDFEGTILFLPSALFLFLAIQWGGVKFPWSSACIMIFFAVFIVTAVVFILVQRYRSDFASIPPRVFKNPKAYGAMFTSFCLNGSIAVMLYYLPLRFQVVQDASPSKLAAMMLPFILSLALTLLASVSIIRNTSYHMPLLIFSSVIMSVGAGLLTALYKAGATSAWIGYEIMFGIGAGSGIYQLLLSIQALFQESRDVATGTAMMVFAQALGSAIAIAIAQSLFQSKLVNAVGAAGFQVVTVQNILHTGVTDIRNVSPGADLETLLKLYTRAIDASLYVSVVLAAVPIVGVLAMAWRPIPRWKHLHE